MLKRFISYYKPYKFLLFCDLFASFLISIFSMVYPIVTRKMLNVYIPNKDIEHIIIFGVALLAIYIINCFLQYFIQYYGHLMGVKMMTDMRTSLFRKLEKLPFSYFDNQETGKVMSHFTNDIFDISELAHHGPELVIMSCLSIVLSFIYLSSINLYLTLIIFFVVPLSIIVVYKTRQQQKEASRKSKAAIAIINGDLSSSISGIRVTKAFNNAEKEIEKFDRNNDTFVEARKMHFKGFSITKATTQLISDIFNVLVLICGGLFLYQEKITFGDYSAFIVSINMFINPIMQLVQFTETLDEGSAGFERFCQLMDEEEEKDDADAKDYANLNGDIEFKNVTFAYQSGLDKEVLEDVSFLVKKGQTIALVGPSGGGKTTICHLLPRFYEISKGKITIDGIDSKKITLSSLRNNIGIVQQDVFLFSGSFYENILYGRLSATKEEVIEAAKKANIYEYIMSYEKGFDTQIGERGVLLSGGQKQRLSIARAFLKNPSILILDEATSALDNSTEALIQQSLNSLKEGRTTIVVAHRLSTVKNADSILVIVNGQIRESGNHEQLLQIENGIYKDLYNSQFKDKSLNIDESLMMR